MAIECLPVWVTNILLFLNHFTFPPAVNKHSNFSTSSPKLVTFCFDITLSHDFDLCFAKNWCFQTVVLEKTLASPLDCKEIQPVHSEGDQSWVFIGRTDAEAEAPILWPPHVMSWFIGKDPDAERDWGQEEKGMTEDEMAGWHHGLDGHEFEWTPGDGDGQGGLACCNSWGCKELDTTERLNWTDRWTWKKLTL